MSAWNNTDLKKCLCWDTAENTWCSDTQCESYLNHAYQGYVAGAVAIIFLVVAAMIWVTFSIVRLCCCRNKKTAGVSQRGIVNGYKLISVMIFVGLIVSCFVATGQAQNDGYDGLRGVLDVVSTKVSNDEASFVIANDAMQNIASLPVNYISHEADTKFQSVYSDVNNYFSKITNANNGILDNYSWVAVVSIWNPILFVMVGLLFILASVRCCLIHINTWILMICMVVVGCVQLLVGAFAFTSRDACADYEGVTKQVVVIWNSAFGAEDINTVTDDINRSFVEHFCYPEWDADWEKYFTHSHACGQFSDTTAIVNEYSAIRSEWKDDAANCPGECTIRDCATSCTPDSSVQQTAKSLVTSLDTVTTNTAVIRNSLIPVVTGETFVTAFAALQSPLCGTFKPATKNVSNSLSASVFFTLFFVIALFFVSFIYYNERRESYEVIQVAVAQTTDNDCCNIQGDYSSVPTEETSVIEYPTKPVAYGSDAPVLK